MYAQVVLGTLTAVVTFLLGRFFLSLTWAFLPAVLVAISPHLISMGGYLLTETLFAFLVQAAIYCFSFAFINRKKPFFVASGLFFGLSYLVNPVIFFLPILLVLAAGYFYIACEKENLIGLRTILIYCLMVFFVIFGAWSARNIINVPPGKSSGSNRLFTNLVIGSHSDFFDIWRSNPRDPNNPSAKDEELLKGSYKDFASLLSKRIIQNPGHYAKWYLIDKPILLWSWNILIGQGDIYVYPVIVSLYQKSNMALATYSIMKSLHYWLLGCAVLGIFFLFKRPIPKVPLFIYIAMIYVSAVYVVTQAEPRYSIPIRSEMYLCAVFFISKVFGYLKSIRSGQLSKAR
jgi:4-amino-4-deoxy-L-arabinose transferase-like glycosyltransferase